MGVACDKPWPLPESVFEAGREFLRVAAQRDITAIACDRDVDGLTSGLLVSRAIERLGGRAELLPVARGENAHSESMRAKIRALKPTALVVTDMGSRNLPVVVDVPTLLIDHHQPRGFPPGAIVVSGHASDPVPCSSTLSFLLVQGLGGNEDLSWLALLGGVADLASEVPRPDFKALRRQYGSKHTTEAVALLNAARRAPQDEVATALRVLKTANAPRDIALGLVNGVDVLKQCREAVNREVKRCFKAAPKFSKTQKVALLRFSSKAQIHPLVATRWAGTLKSYAVIAANDEFLPGRVNFSVRTATGESLIELLCKAQPAYMDAEFGYGHHQATGGSLAYPEFEALLQALGFEH